MDGCEGAGSDAGLDLLQGGGGVHQELVEMSAMVRVIGLGVTVESVPSSGAREPTPTLQDESCCLMLVVTSPLH